MSKQSISDVMEKIPELTDNGIDRNTMSKEYNILREKLLNSVEIFDKTIDWLSSIKKIKNINTKRTSYGLKHIAEKSIGYLSNGVFIAAAVHCGFKYKYLLDSPNVSFNMSESNIKKLENR